MDLGVQDINLTITTNPAPTLAITSVGGPKGDQGVQGIQGVPGSNGTNGTNGQGVPAGGTASQVLTKINATDYNAQWSTPVPAPVSSVNTLTGAVVLTQDNIADGTTNKQYSAADKTKLAAITGTNTGDETATTIKTKLGISTLSGANTGDQDLSSYALISTVTPKADKTYVDTQDTALQSQITSNTSALAGKLPVSGTTTGDIYVDYVGGKTDANVDFDLNMNVLGTLKNGGTQVSLNGHQHVATTDLVAAGTKDATTFLRGDNTWATPSGGSTYDPATDTLHVLRAGDTMTGNFIISNTATQGIQVMSNGNNGFQMVGSSLAPSKGTWNIKQGSDGTFLFDQSGSMSGRFKLGGTTSGNFFDWTPDYTNSYFKVQGNKAVTTFNNVLDNGSGSIGVLTTSPTHSFTLGSTATGITLYNTSDQTTNYERATASWATNIFSIVTGNGGTGAAREARFGNTTGYYSSIPSAVSGNPKFVITYTTSTSGSLLNIASPGFVGGAGVSQYGLAITPTYNQTSTASGTDLLINRIQTAVGSGAQLLIDAQVGSSSKFKIDNTGLITATNRITSVTDPTGAQDVATKNYVDTNTHRARSSFYAFEDFINNVNTSTFLSTASGGSVGTLAALDASGIGIATLNTGATATGRAGQWSNSSTTLYFDTTATWTCESRVRLSALSSATDTYQMFSGFLDSSTAESTDGAYFSYTDSLNSGKFELVTSSNGVRTRTDSTITVAAATWYVLKVVVLSVAGTLTARFYINDVQVGGDVTTNIPSTSARVTGYGTHIIKSVGTTNVFVGLDYMEILGTFSANR